MTDQIIPKPSDMPRAMSLLPSVRDEWHEFTETWGDHIDDVVRIYNSIVDGGVHDENAAATLTLAVVMLSPEEDNQ